MGNDKDKIQIRRYSWATTRTKYRWGGTLGQQQGQNTDKEVLLGKGKGKYRLGGTRSTTRTKYRWGGTLGQRQGQNTGGIVLLGNGKDKIQAW